MRAALLILVAFSAQESGRPVCECKPREVGPSGSRQDWKGYRKLRPDADAIRVKAHRDAAGKAADRIRREVHRRLAEASFTLSTFPANVFEDLQKLYSEGGAAASNE